MVKLSRRLQELHKKVEDRAYAPIEALNLLKETATAKFPESAEAHIRLGIDPKYADQQLRTTVADKTGIVHVMFGKVSFPAEDLLVNLKALQETIDRNRPSGAKGRYWRTVYVAATMGPSIEVDVSSLRDLKFGDAA